VVTVRGKVLDEGILSYLTGMWKPIQAFNDFEENCTIVDKLVEVVFVENGGREKLHWDAHPLRARKVSVEVEVLDVDGHELCVIGDNGLQEHLDNWHCRRIGLRCSVVVDAVAANGATNAVYLFIVFDFFLSLWVIVGSVSAAIGWLFEMVSGVHGVGVKEAANFGILGGLPVGAIWARFCGSVSEKGPSSLKFRAVFCALPTGLGLDACSRANRAS